MDLKAVRAILTEWAQAHPLVGHLWLFGSRARGDHRSDSDMDIAIELDLSAAKGVDESGGMATWAFDTDGWKEELQERLGLSIDLNQYLGSAVWSNIHRALEQSSILVYVKPGFVGEEKPVVCQT